MQRRTYKKRFILGNMACFFALSAQGFLPGEAISPGETPPFLAPEQVAASPRLTEARELFQQAYAAYSKARPMTALGAGSEPYAEAIDAITRAIALEPENVDYLLLASQIYRGKGGISSAKEYFNRAEAVLLDHLSADPDSIDANLDYAILCYAGDVRYWANYSTYLKKAKKHADRVLSLCNKETHPFSMALACLIKGNAKECERLLEMSGHPTVRFYYILYKNTVRKGTWYWPVKDAGKEYLLYCMTDPNRHRLSSL